MGVAVQSHWFAVGTIVTWAEAGVGAVATQALTDPSYGPNGLGLMRDGASALEALRTLLDRDQYSSVRQVAMVDSKGNVAAFTGKRCIPKAGHIEGQGFSVQANMMLSDEVWPAMEKRFLQWKGSLAERMMAALEAAEEAGGDIRGRQSAAILVVRSRPSGRPWEDRVVDIRVDDHKEPIAELKRLLRIHRAYQHMNMGDKALETEDMSAALKHYSLAERMFPRNLEMKFWHAVGLANNGHFQDALPLFKKIFERDENWKELAMRIISVGMLRLEEDQVERLFNL